MNDTDKTEKELLKEVEMLRRRLDEKKRAEEELGYRINLKKLITGISTRFVNLATDEVDRGINEALKTLGEFMDTDRSYIFQFSEDNKTMNNTHEWAAEGIEPKSSELRNFDVDMFSWSISRIKKEEIIHVPRVGDLPRKAGVEKEEFQSEEIQSLLMVPLVCGGSVFGFVGFDSVWKEKSWEEDVISLIKIVGEIFASTLERKRMEEELRYRVEFEELITSISAKFVTLTPEHADDAINDALRELGEFTGVDRSFVFQFLEDENTVLRTHFWSAEGVKPLAPGRVEIKFRGVPWGLDIIKRLEVLQVTSIASLPRKATEIREYMTSNGIQSLVCIPFTYNEKDIGILGFSSEREERKWPEDIISLLKIVGEVFAGALGRKGRSSTLERQQVLMNALMDNVPDHIYFKDRENRFIKVNKAQAQLFGMTDPSEVVGKTDRDFFTDEHASQAHADEQEIMKSGRSIMAKEEKETWPDGSETWASTTKMPLRDADGQIIGTFGISRNITAIKQAEEERKRIEARLQHTQKLERLGIVSGEIAHDFNNFLMGILGNTGLALMELVPESPAWANVKQIETVALRAAALTNQMLIYSGKSKFVVKPLNLSTLVREMADLLKVSISRKVKLEYNFAESVSLIEGDPAQIRQVVMNLITNASEAIGKKAGTIVVGTGQMDCDSSYIAECYVSEGCLPGCYVYLEVSDTGIGMDVETQEKIFDPFFTTKVKGRGLGLAAVLGIVRGHKGALRVYSEVAKGTDFKVLFPCSENRIEEVDIEKEQRSQWQGSGTVLVVDDDEVVRMVTEQILLKFGFSVLTASDGESAIKLVKKECKNIVAVLLDITLPEMKGEEVLDGIQRIKRDVPVIVISGFNEESATSHLPAGSFQGFLQKPFNMDMLSKKLQKVLGEG